MSGYGSAPDGENLGPLTDNERTRFHQAIDRIERAVEKVEDSQAEIAEELCAIRDGHLYRETHRSFEAFIKAGNAHRIGSKTHADRLARYGHTRGLCRLLGPAVPVSEWQVRPITGCDDEQQLAVLRVVISRGGLDGLTQTDIARIRDEVLSPRPDEPLPRPERTVLVRRDAHFEPVDVDATEILSALLEAAAAARRIKVLGAYAIPDWCRAADRADCIKAVEAATLVVRVVQQFLLAWNDEDAPAQEEFAIAPRGLMPFHPEISRLLLATSEDGDARPSDIEARAQEVGASELPDGERFVGGACADPSRCEYRWRHASGPWTCPFNHPTESA